MESNPIKEVSRRLSELDAQPKTLSAKLMQLLPVIERLISDGHSYPFVIEQLHRAGLEFNDASFNNSLYRARIKRARLQARKIILPEPREDRINPGTPASVVPASVTPRPVAMRSVAVQLKPGNERALSNEDLASLLVSSAKEKPVSREFQFSSTPVPKDQRRG